MTGEAGVTMGAFSAAEHGMSMTSPDQIVLADAERAELVGLIRAGVILQAADGQPNTVIASSLGVCEDTRSHGFATFEADNQPRLDFWVGQRRDLERI